MAKLQIIVGIDAEITLFFYISVICCTKTGDFTICRAGSSAFWVVVLCASHIRQ
jgi:hypothetical protein